MYNDETCLPTAKTPCSTAGYPAYVIEAETATDVQAGVRFARDTGVRLIVKGTGHDVSGRSAGAGSLSIWTHRFQGIDVKMNDPVAVKNGGVASVKLEAGMVWGDVYKAVGKSNLTVIGGADPHVGVGGWMQGGGHGPLSSLYGLGADQVLEMEVVTADGECRNISPESNPELFWAMRGGGPSSFAVMLSMTVKAYPRLAGHQYGFQYNTTASSDTFWDLTANFSSRLPTLNDHGAMGYYYFEQDAGLANRSSAAAIYGTFIFPNKNRPEVDAITKPLEDSLRSAPWAREPVYVGSKTVGFDNFMQFWAATNAAESALESQMPSQLEDQTQFCLLGGGHMHILCKSPALRSLAPKSGAYANEGDPSNSNWKAEYFGEPYERLLDVKSKWDPLGVFWCKPCVGFDEWNIKPLNNVHQDVNDRGIGQDLVRRFLKTCTMNSGITILYSLIFRVDATPKSKMGEGLRSM
ncbi:hypothetical protein PRZ48_013334 [Zasmidium cellare]|uniref:FAD-binding PCMH-type domain-containing protein n=1 Tax=Zasmidium cellare TaxID=395010 RepID=A0ABR0E0Q8_ZASCE|nr:hypothetical protein PRZ48_013334 [Zasmidium cellare]